MARSVDAATPVEVLKAQVLMTDTGYPAPLSIVRDAYGSAMPAPEPGWFWIFATPRSAADTRARGLHARGTLTITFIPPQTRGPEVDERVTRDDVPAIGSSEFLEVIQLTTEERRSRVYQNVHSRISES